MLENLFRKSLPFLLICWVVSIGYPVYSQYSNKYEPKITRILFLVDGSGSMKDEWDAKSKFSISKNLILDILDSLQNSNNKIEFAIRVFGHQSPRSQKNCSDSKLEVSFGRHNVQQIGATLDKIKPKGWTPIAYSLELAAKDFPRDPAAKNAIILITDGLETCGGDLCATGETLQRNRISLRPFIIGLGIGESHKNYFDCVGRYYDASSSVSFKKVLSTVISQALNTTTAQINLINQFGKASETNLEISLYDGFSGQLIYNFIHTLNDNGFPDTLKLDPVGKYTIAVHSTPSVIKKDIELTPGKHNIIPVDVPRGSLKLIEGNGYNNSLIQGIIRRKGDPKTLSIQDCNTTKKYLTGKYEVEILTLPRTLFKNVEINQSQVKEIFIDNPGKLNITSSKGGIASIFVVNDGKMERIFKFDKILGKEIIDLQPGKYTMIYRLNESKNANLTQVKEFEISSGATTSIRF